MRSRTWVCPEGVLTAGRGQQPLSTREQCGAGADAEPSQDAVVLGEPRQVCSDGRVHAHCLSLHQAEQVHVRLVGEDLRVGSMDPPGTVDARSGRVQRFDDAARRSALWLNQVG